MRIALVGAGSMGIIIGAYLTRDGHDVELFDSYKANVQALQKNGAKVVHLEEENTFTIPVKAYTTDKMSGIYDLVLLTTKQTANPVVLPALLPHLSEDSMVCALQNGIPEPAVAEVIGDARTIGGAMMFGGTWLEPGVSAETSNFESFKRSAFELGEVGRPATPRLQEVAKILQSVGGTVMMDNLMEVKWTKLCVNSCGSGMSAALGCTFGEAVENKKSLVCQAFIVKECLEVCHAEGYKMVDTGAADFETFYWTNREEMRYVMDTLRAMWNNLPTGKASMLQDLEKKQKSEIDYIDGHVATYGRKHGIATPFCDKVVELVKEAEARGGVNDISYISRFDELLVGYEDMYS
ncbi:ketopantoate reductase family protein [Ruminococcaceae bacterium OttesenSCG-928-O06]|nr:ketopantoate reductase family protein [Ruminococcaceae bacterium OttesenSCG-928-O06]